MERHIDNASWSVNNDYRKSSTYEVSCHKEVVAPLPINNFNDQVDDVKVGNHRNLFDETFIVLICT